MMSSRISTKRTPPFLPALNRMFSLSTAWKIARDLGPLWVLKRIGFELQMRLGILKRRLPVSSWDFASRDWLRADALASADDFKQSLRRQSKFFFDPSSLPKPTEPAGVCSHADRVLSGEWPFFSHTWRESRFPPDWHLNPLDGKRADDQRHWSARLGYRGQVTGDREPQPPHVASDVKFVWETSRFAVVYTLVRAYAGAKDDRYAEAFWMLVEDWADKNPPNRGVNWASGQEVAVRVMAWYFGLYGFLESPATSAPRVFKLVRMIEKHGERIAGFIEYALSQRNNHGISEAVGLFTIGVLSPQLRRAVEWVERGRDLIVSQLREQVYEDGSYVQHSFNYERVLLDNLLWAFRLGELNGSRFPDESYHAIAKAIAFMLRFCDPQTGRMPNYGANDGSLVLPLSACDYTDYRPSLQAAHYVVHREHCFDSGPWNELTEWLFAGELSKAESGVPETERDFASQERLAPAAKALLKEDRLRARINPCPSLKQKAFLQDLQEAGADSGYLKLTGRESYALLRAARYRDRPSQADQLHLDLWWRGENIACDAGTYLYNGAEPWANVLAGTGVHNTVTVAGRDQMTRAGRFLWVDWAQAESVNYRVGTANAVEAWHYGYSRIGVQHRRSVFYSDEQDFWIVVDDVLGKSVLEARLHWLFSDFPYQWINGRLRMAMPKAAFDCFVYSSVPSATTLVRGAEPISGEREKVSEYELQIRGWRSLYYGEKQPALSLAVTTQSALPVRFITVLSPAEVQTVAIDQKQVILASKEGQAIVSLNAVGTKPVFQA